jgi:hypothetical protein
MVSVSKGEVKMQATNMQIDQDVDFEDEILRVLT